MAHEDAQTVKDEWVSFPGGELEGKRPKALCPECREALKRDALEGGASSVSGQSRPPGWSRPLCFQCYRAGLDRERAIGGASQLDTASEARFQFQLPLEPVNRSRLDGLKAARAEARTASVQGIGAYVDKRRRAQIAARHALQAIATGLLSCPLSLPRSCLRPRSVQERGHELADAIHAAELQLPEAWLPFVVSR
jgi:hypothetical protein